MLFNAQRPHMRKRTVARIINQQILGKCCKLPERLNRRRFAGSTNQKINCQDSNVGGKDPKSSPDVERADAGFLSAHVANEKLIADEKTAEHKKEVHTHPSVRCQMGERGAKTHLLGMVKHDSNDCCSAQQVQSRGMTAHAAR